MEVLDRGDMDSIITWLPHGRAFIVRHSQKLKEIVLPRFFKQSKFMSFTRQLNLWGFKRITKGTDAGAYYHELFLRGRPLLSTLMRRQKIKGTGIKLTPNPDTEPNFYKISDKRPLPPVKTDKKELEPLPPISTSLCASKNTSRAEESETYLSGGNPSSLDMYMHQQRMEQQSQLQGMRQAQLPFGRIGGGSFSGPPSHQASFQDNHLAGLEMLQREAHLRPMSRLSAPTTSADFSLVAGSLQKQAMERHAIASAQQVLNEVNTHPAVAVHNPVEDLKQKLLNAVHTLEKSQAVSSTITAPSPQPSSLNARSTLTQSLMGNIHAHGLTQHQGLPPASQAGLPPFYPYQSSAAAPPAATYPPSSGLLPPHHQPQAFLGQAPPAPPAEPSRESIAALMTALDQTRQVAAAAQAQSSLLQQVANDLALGRHSKK